MKVINALNRESLNVTLNLNNIHFDCHSIEDIDDDIVAMSHCHTIHY